MGKIGLDYNTPEQPHYKLKLISPNSDILQVMNIFSPSDALNLITKSRLSAKLFKRKLVLFAYD